MSTRRRFTGAFKAKVALEGMKEIFSKGAERSRGAQEGEIRELYAKIGELTVERGQLSLRRRPVRLYHLVGVVGNALRRFAELLDRPVGIALGHVARPRVVTRRLVSERGSISSRSGKGDRKDANCCNSSCRPVFRKSSFQDYIL